MGVTYGRLAAAIDSARPRDPQLHTRDLAQVMDQHIAWHETGTSPQRALSLPAVFSVVRLIASTIDQLDVKVEGGPMPRWLDKPRRMGGALDLGDLLQHVVVDMALRGSAYLLCTRSGESWRLDAVHHDSVGVQVSQFGALDMRFTFNGDPIPRLSDPGEHARALLHIPYMVTPERPQGTSPILETWPTLAGFLRVEAQAADLLDMGTYSGGVLSTDADITADSAKRYQDKWIQARRTGAIPVLGAGLRYDNLLISPKEGSWLESRTHNHQVVASLYGVPPSQLGLTQQGGSSSLSYSNAQDERARFRTSALEGFTTQMADALSELLPPGRNETEDQLVTFDYTGWEAAANAASDVDA